MLDSEYVGILYACLMLFINNSVYIDAANMTFEQILILIGVGFGVEIVSGVVSYLLKKHVPIE